jgi:surfeit locus 1 family protein
MADFAISIGRVTFKPTLIPSLITAVVLSLLLTLGFWQLSRARHKEDLQVAFATQSNLSHVPIEQIDLGATASRYRRVVAQGRYDTAQQILMDNQVQDGQAGYHVYTPLRLSDSELAILVNRGWVPLGPSRRQLPDVTMSAAVASVHGRLSQPVNPGILLANPESTGAWPRVVQHVDYDELAAALGYPLAPAIMLLDPDAEQGYRRDWRPLAEGFGPERHRGYAAQWFSLAIALLAIYIVVNTVRNARPTPNPSDPC